MGLPSGLVQRSKVADANVQKKTEDVPSAGDAMKGQLRGMSFAEGEAALAPAPGQKPVQQQVQKITATTKKKRPEDYPTGQIDYVRANMKGGRPGGSVVTTIAGGA